MKECPRCHQRTMRENKIRNSVSRRDGKTYICPGCGNEEAFIDAGLLKPGRAELEFIKTHNRFSGR